MHTVIARPESRARLEFTEETEPKAGPSDIVADVD